jgi:hypothetical protein
MVEWKERKREEWEGQEKEEKKESDGRARLCGASRRQRRHCNADASRAVRECNKHYSCFASRLTANDDSFNCLFVYIASTIDITSTDFFFQSCLKIPLGSRGVASALHTVEWVASRPGRSNPQGFSSGYATDKRPCGPKSLSGRCGEEKNLLSLPGIKPQPPQPRHYSDWTISFSEECNVMARTNK